MERALFGSMESCMGECVCVTDLFVKFLEVWVCVKWCVWCGWGGAVGVCVGTKWISCDDCKQFCDNFHT